MTCTSMPCEWDQGTLKRDPGIANERQYDSFKIDVIRRASFDVRPTQYQCAPSEKRINDFLCAMSYKKSHWELLLKINYPDGDYNDGDLHNCFPVQRGQFYETLKSIVNDLKPHDQYEGPVEVNDTRGQSNNDFWSSLRSLHATASTCRKVSHFKTDSAKMHHLQKHLWNLNKVTTKAMRYGTKHEDDARKEYIKKRSKDDPSLKVAETGMFLHTQHPGLSCSPDGSVTSDLHSPKLLEIKCPFTLRANHPKDFDKVLSSKKLSSYFLKRSANNELYLNTGHEYYDQIQMNLGLTETKECDLVVWSEKGTIILPIGFDEERWTTIRAKLKTFHWKYQVPEYFLMRTVRNLPPLPLGTIP